MYLETQEIMFCYKKLDCIQKNHSAIASLRKKKRALEAVEKLYSV